MKLRVILCALSVMSLSVSAQQSSPPATPDYEQMNQVFGASIWQDDNLWQNAVSEVAERLQWPEESKTSSDSSYRLYADSKVRILDARPFSLALYGVDEKPTQISMVFANKGDVAELSGIDLSHSDTKARIEAEKAVRDYKKYIRQDAETIQKKLTELLGPPQGDRFGQGRNTREQVKRWDWKGHSILLAAPRDEYVAVRIVPTASLGTTPAARISDSDMRAKLSKRVEHRENGDVILTEIPMVNQGPKGYCVPATWERALRYVGIPADMYVLAMAGKTEAGGGTSVQLIAQGANALVQVNGRRMVAENGQLQMHNIAKYINQGLPILWTLFAEEGMIHDTLKRTAERQSTTDWEAWKKSLDPIRKEARKIPIHRASGHMCMIIGYNEKTGEIALSDSWGEHFAERWVTLEEANAVNQGYYSVIIW